MKAIGSMEVGVTCEEPNVLELDEYAEERQNVEFVDEGRDRRESVGGVSQTTIEIGRRTRAYSCHPNEVGRREQRR